MRKLLVSILIPFSFLTLGAQVISSGKTSIKISTGSSGVKKDEMAKPVKEAREVVMPHINLLSIRTAPDTVIKWEKDKITLAGNIRPAGLNTLFFINGNEVPLNESGVFSHIQKLREGSNPLYLVAMSAENQTDELNFIVEFHPSSESAAEDISGKFFALIIGINDYADTRIGSLDHPVSDAEKVYDVLTRRYTFEKENIRLLRNATHDEINDALDYFARIIKPTDSFLIFYAGHGKWDPEAKIGFWMPSDAQTDRTVDWFRNSTLRDYLLEIRSKHTLLISDACFAGSIFKTRAVFSDADMAINKLFELLSRKAMTSGSLTAVPDESVFVKYLLDRLENNMDKYLSSEQLFNKLKIPVMNNSNLVPAFGEIRDVGDEGGDFIFILRDRK